MDDEQPAEEQGRPKPESQEAAASAVAANSADGSAGEVADGSSEGRPKEDVAEPPVEEPAPPPVAAGQGVPAYDWSKPPEPTAWQQPVDRPVGAMDHLIPTKNPPALIGYYLGCFSVIPCLMPFLGPAAIVCGIKGLKTSKDHPGLPGTGQAVTAIVLGVLTTLTFVVALVFVLINVKRA